MLALRSPEPHPIVRPMCVWAAGRSAFEATIQDPAICSKPAKRLLFDEIPLVHNGWDFQTAGISLVSRAADYSVWRLERQAEPSPEGGSA